MTLEAQYKKYLKENSLSTLTFDLWKDYNSHNIKQALVNMMKADEELGLYEQIDQDNPVLKGSTTLVKKETKELNHHIGPFLLKNGFSKHKIRPHVYKNNVYHNSECTVKVLEGCYEIIFEDDFGGEVTTYTDTWSIPHLVGTLTWNDLIDKNYNK
jgi:hypothetical protein